MPWPARSPDLSRNENLWDRIGLCLLRNGNSSTTRKELWNQVNTVWQEIPQEIISNLILSLNNRLNERIKKKGWLHSLLNYVQLFIIIIKKNFFLML